MQLLRHAKADRRAGIVVRFGEPLAGFVMTCLFESMRERAAIVAVQRRVNMSRSARVQCALRRPRGASEASSSRSRPAPATRRVPWLPVARIFRRQGPPLRRFTVGPDHALAPIVPESRRVNDVDDVERRCCARAICDPALGRRLFRCRRRWPLDRQTARRRRPDAGVAGHRRAAGARGSRLPLLVRFADILHHRLSRLQGAFAQAMREWDYAGGYSAVYPVKVNQQKGVAGELARSAARASASKPARSRS